MADVFLTVGEDSAGYPVMAPSDNDPRYLSYHAVRKIGYELSLVRFRSFRNVYPFRRHFNRFKSI